MKISNANYTSFLIKMYGEIRFFGPLLLSIPLVGSFDSRYAFNRQATRVDITK